MPAQLKHGVTGSNGGAREGAGRKPDWLKEKCKAIVKDKKLIEFLGDVANGKSIEQVVNAEGETLPLPAPVKDRIKATELLLDRGFGKVTQTLEHTGDAGGRLLFIHPEALK